LAKLTNTQLRAIHAKNGQDSDITLIGLGISKEEVKKSKILNINTNQDNPLDKFPKKDFKLWIVKEPDGSEKVKGSETIVRSQHYGQAVDDFIIDWNKKRRLNRTIGYPVVQGIKKGEEA